MVGGDRRLVDARRADRGVLGHDDLLAGDRRQHGVPLDRLGQIGHGPHAGRVRRWKGNWPAVGRAEVAAAAELLLALRPSNWKTSTSRAFSLLGLLHRPADHPASPLAVWPVIGRVT